jgi:hypothetical protein
MAQYTLLNGAIYPVKWHRFNGATTHRPWKCASAAFNGPYPAKAEATFSLRELLQVEQKDALPASALALGKAELVGHIAAGFVYDGIVRAQGVREVLREIGDLPVQSRETSLPSRRVTSRRVA